MPGDTIPQLTIYVFAVHQGSHLIDDLRVWRYLISAIPIGAAVGFISCTKRHHIDASYLVKCYQRKEEQSCYGCINI
jgi:hypothetical protein